MNRARALGRFAVTAVVLTGVWLGGQWLIGRLADQVTTTRRDDRVRVAKTAAAALDQAWFRPAQDEIAAVAGALSAWDGSPEAAAPALALPAKALDDGVMVVDRAATVVGASPPAAGLVGHPVVWPAVRQAIDGGQPTLSGVVEDPVDRSPLVVAAQPVKDVGGQVVGAVAGRSRAADGLLAHVLTDVRRAAAPGPPILLVAPDGMLVSGGGEPVRDGGALVEGPRARGDAGGFVEYRGEAGVPTVAGYAVVRGGWMVVVPEPAADFAGAIGSRKLVASVALADLLVLVLVVLTWTDRRRRIFQRRADQAQRSLLAIAGHELRTPLTVIRGFSTTMLSRWDRLTDDDRREMVRTIGLQARGLEHQVERLLVAAQLEAGLDTPPPLENTDVSTVLDSVVELHKGLAPLHTIALDTERPLMARADLDGLEEVVSHLVENAVKYSPSGGGVWVSGRRASGKIEMVVEDEGVGLPAEIDKIFEPFVQGEAVNTRTYDEGGVGLGLFIVRRTVEMMNGRVRAERRTPRGSRFVVSLPAPDR